MSEFYRKVRANLPFGKNEITPNVQKLMDILSSGKNLSMVHNENDISLEAHVNGSAVSISPAYNELYRAIKTLEERYIPFNQDFAKLALEQIRLNNMQPSESSILIMERLACDV